MPFDFDAVTAPFRMQPGLRKLAPGAPQLTPNRIGDRALLEKTAVLSQHAQQALLCVPGFDAGPALQALLRHAATEHPDAIRLSADGAVTALHLGWSVQAASVQGSGPRAIGRGLRALPPEWRVTGLLCLAFAQDFAVIEADAGRLPWLAVCLPSHWAPHEKIGLSFAQVHAPVADNQTLLAARDHLARLVTGAQRWERFVWTITTDAALDNHPQRRARIDWPAEQDADAQALAALAFWRTEHQTFIPVPDRGQAVFTIHVQVQSLAQTITRPEQARVLHAALGSMSDAVLRYRGLAPARRRLLSWLAQRGAGGAGGAGGTGGTGGATAPAP